MGEFTGETSLGLATDIGPVDLVLPPLPSLLRVARLTASALASLVGFSIDEIENVKIAVSEVMIVLIDQGDGQPIELVFNARPDSFRIVGRTTTERFDLEHPDLALCRMVLEEVCTELHIAFDVESAEISGTIGRVSPSPASQ